LEPASGTVSWDGADVTHTPVHQRGFGLVFQAGQLFPHRTVARNVAFGLEMEAMARPERAARVEELLELVGLPGLGKRAVAELSGGERQRVALARSLAPRPRLLALDEPLSSLDSELRQRLAVEVRDILLAAGTTAIVVTHDRAEAQTMASRVIEMEAGRLR
jgi:thiamine transport system ATP-binding protein